MMHLLKIEWMKLRKYTAFKVLCIFFIIGVFATNYIVYSVNKTIVEPANTTGLLSFSPYSFENTWQTTSYFTGYILLLPSLLLIMLLTNEYTYKTHRQNIIDGLSRRQFISVKIMMAFLFALASLILVIITAMIFGFISGSSFSIANTEYLAFFFLKALSYNMIAILIAVLIKRSGFAIGMFFIYLGAENIISQLLVSLSMKIRSLYQLDLGNLGDYLPMNASDGLLTFPKNTISKMAKSLLPTDYTWLVISLALVYLAIFYGWVRRKFIHSDL